MVKISEVEKLALQLPEPERAVLASHLLGSLSAVLHDEDDGLAEALRRDAELETDPAHAISLDELTARIRSRRQG